MLEFFPNQKFQLLFQSKQIHLYSSALYHKDTAELFDESSGIFWSTAYVSCDHPTMYEQSLKTFYIYLLKQSKIHICNIWNLLWFEIRINNPCSRDSKHSGCIKCFTYLQLGLVQSNLIPSSRDAGSESQGFEHGTNGTGHKNLPSRFRDIPSSCCLALCPLKFKMVKQ